MAQPLARTHWWHWRSMRLHTVLVVCLIAAAPVVWIWGSGLADEGTRVRRSLNVQGVAGKLVGFHGDVAALADHSKVRIRAWDPSGALVVDEDGTRPGAWERWDAPFDDQEEATLATFEAERAPPLQRALLRDAGPVPLTECKSNEALTLWVCESVVVADGRTWLVQRSSRRVLRELYALRYRVLQVALLVGVLALFLGVWIAWRWVQPIAALRDAALQRVDHPLAAPPLNLRRNDELGDLALAFDQLLAAVRSQSQANEAFVSDLAHEMKNPVAAIRSCAELLGGDAPMTAERQARVARIIQDSTERLQRVLSELLDLARAEAGLPGDEREIVDLKELVRGVAPEQVVHGDSVRVLAVVERLEALVRNLVDNALGFSDGVELEVRREGELAVLVVRDHGPGIAEEQLSRVFDRFFTTRAEGRGTGVGLALVKAVAEAHGGSVSVRSDGGAEFTVRLPAV